MVAAGSPGTSSSLYEGSTGSNTLQGMRGTEIRVSSSGNGKPPKAYRFDAALDENAGQVSLGT